MTNMVSEFCQYHVRGELLYGVCGESQCPKSSD